MRLAKCFARAQLMQTRPQTPASLHSGGRGSIVSTRGAVVLSDLQFSARPQPGYRLPQSKTYIDDQEARN